MAKPRLIREIVPGPVVDLAQEESQLRTLGNFVYFRASDPANGSELWRSDGTPAGTKLLKDLRVGKNSSFPRPLGVAGNNLYFSARQESGQELWKTDGTEKETVLVREIMPGPLGSYPNSPTALGTTMLFFAADGNPSGENSNGEKVWRSNGSQDGTSPVVFENNRSVLMNNPVEVNNGLYFVSSDGSSGQELWRCDLNLANATRVRDINERGSSFPTLLTRMGSQLYFFADNGSDGRELWRSDGSVDGTTLVKNINTGTSKGSSPKFMTLVGSTLFFCVDDGAAGYELWKSDGTSAGTVIVRDINVGAGSSFAGVGSSSAAVVLDNLLYFTANDGVSGTELWKSDGTASGTTRIKDIRVGAASSDPQSLTVINGKLYFTADDGKSGRELWRSDGTDAGTVLVDDLKVGSAGSYPKGLTQTDNNLFFTAISGDNGQALWSMDVTRLPQVSVSLTSAVAGEDGQDKLVFSFQRTGSLSSPLTINYKLSGTANAQTSALGAADFTGLPKDAKDGVAKIVIPPNANRATLTLDPNADQAFEPDETVTLSLIDGDGYEYDTNSAVTGTIKNDEALKQVRDIKPGPGSSNPSYLKVFNNTLYFSADDGDSGVELWKSDGTTSGTVLVSDIYAKGNSSNPNNLTPVGGSLLFSAENADRGRELWKTNGTTEGTSLLNDIRGGLQPSNPKDFTVLGNTLLFSATDGNYGDELFKADGISESGTSRVRDLNTRGDSSPNSFAIIGNQAIFVASNPDKEIWRTDGTSGGTLRLKDIFAGETSSNPEFLTAVGTTVYFKADHASYGEELWKTDGTADGTRIVKDSAAGSSGSLPSELTAFGNRLVYKAFGSSGYEVWISDGSEEGTKMLLDINPGPQGSDPGEFTAVGNTLYFTATDGKSGIELWKTDGTAAGTKLVRDILAGTGSSRPKNLTAVGDTLFFTADDGKSGTELWMSNGTSEGTVLVGDINRGSGSADPLNLTAADNRLYFTAVDDINCGRELWSYDLPRPVQSLEILAVKADQREGNAGAMTYTFAVSRTGNLQLAASATWTVAARAGANSADQSDFMNAQFPSGTVTLAPGVRSVNISVPVLGDTSQEPDESFTVLLSNPKGASLKTASAVGIIRSDEISAGSLVFKALAPDPAEGISGITQVRYSLERNGNASLPASFRWRVRPTGQSPVSADDFVGGIPTGQIAFAAGQAKQELMVRIAADQRQESDESFTVEILDTAGAVAASVQSQILNDDFVTAAGTQTLLGTRFADYLDGGRDRDVITGDLGADVFALRSGDSSVNAADLITDFSFGSDKFSYFTDMTGTPGRVAIMQRVANNSAATTLEALAREVFADVNSALPGAQPLRESSGVLVVSQNPSIAGTYLFVNNSNPQFNLLNDVAVRINGISAAELPAVGPIDVARFFV